MAAFGQPLSMLETIPDVLGDTFSWISRKTGVTQACPFVEDPIRNMNQMLPAYIRGQDHGVDAITNAIAAWQFSRQAGHGVPLVLAITGPTGVGKSESGFIIAEAVLASKERIGVSRRYRPLGYLVLRGEEYSNTSDAYVSGGLPEIHRRLNMRVAEHVKTCDGGGVVVFDEVQKVVPGTLDVLVSGLKERGEFTVHKNTGTKDERTLSYSTSDLIFILTSDIGADRMIKLLLAYDRSQVPQHILRTEVKKSLDDQWERLKFGSLVSEVVPYLPLERDQIEEIIAMKLMSLSEEKQHLYWLSLSVDEDVIKYLSGPNFIMYDKYSRQITLEKGKGSTTVEKIFATYGARGVDNGGPIQDLRSAMFRHMQPWRPGYILHVGITGHKSKESGWTTLFSRETEIFMQWCIADTSMLPSNEIVEATTNATNEHEGWTSRSLPKKGYKRVGRYVVQNSHSNSPLCDTMWKGKFSSSTSLPAEHSVS